VAPCLVDCRLELLLAKHFDQPLDLAPAAIMDDVAKVAAAARTGRRFIRRETAKALDQLGRLGGGGGIGKVHVRVQSVDRLCLGKRMDSPLGLTKCRKTMFNNLLSIFSRWPRPAAAAIARR